MQEGVEIGGKKDAHSILFKELKDRVKKECEATHSWQARAKESLVGYSNNFLIIPLLKIVIIFVIHPLFLISYSISSYPISCFLSHVLFLTPCFYPLCFLFTLSFLSCFNVMEFILIKV